MEDYERHLNMYYSLLNEGLDNPNAILLYPGKVHRILKQTISNKEIRLKKLAKWWQISTLPGDILEDVQNGQQQEFELRNKLADSKKGAPGLAWKCSSFLMSKLGYDNIAILDVWALRFLDTHSVNVRLPDYRRVSGPSGKNYLLLEQAFQEISSLLKVSPGDLHPTVWAKMSGWYPGQHLNLIEKVTHTSPQLHLPTPTDAVTQPILL